MEKKDDLSHLVPNPKESDSDTNNAVVASEDGSRGCFSNDAADIDQSNKFDTQTFNEIMEFGFEKEKVELAMKMSSDKQQIIDLIMKMNDDPEFFRQVKENAFKPRAIAKPIVPLNFFNQASEYKMVIVVRKDLGMGVGKIAAQVGHAVLGCYKLACQNSMMNVHIWENCGTPKIVLGCENLEELMALRNKANASGITNCVISDAGRTEVAEGTITCCGFGPDLVNKIDLITGKLKLL